VITNWESRGAGVCHLEAKDRHLGAAIAVTAVRNKDAGSRESMRETVREAMQEMGAVWQAYDTASLAGTEVDVVCYSLKSRRAGTLASRTFILPGSESYFLLAYSVPESQEHLAEPLLWEVLATIKVSPSQKPGEGVSRSAGEILGNTFTSTKYGYFEISSPDGKWQLKYEQAPSLCSLITKDAVGGTWYPYLTVAALTNTGNAMDEEGMRKAAERTIANMGATPRGVGFGRIRLAGKKALVAYFAADAPTGGKMNGRMYMLAGSESVFILTYAVHESIEQAAEPLLQTVLSTVKF
jgi:hypothetical protein